MRPPYQRWIQCTAASLVVISLGACGLPKGERTPSTAMKASGGTTLAKAVGPRVAAHPGESGIHPLPDARDAMAARMALADTAQRSLDVQYFIWQQDLVGKVLLERLLRAADRGVRVRLLLDDFGTVPSDEVLHTIDSHPNIELRMFNPVRLRSPRMLGFLVDIGRLNRRMHNKSFTADGTVSIVGGRNIGDEYFGAHAGANFADLDVVLVGPAVKDVSNEFDLYWNHPTAVPMTTVSRKKATPEEMAAKRAGLVEHRGTAGQTAYAESLRESEFARQLKNRDLSFYWGRATIVNDHPDKVLTSSSKSETHLSPQLHKVIDRTKREMFLVSPYFVPGKKGVDLLVGVRQRGARVVVLTNSLASTDGVHVHSKYQLYREPLLQAGVELYEIKPTSGGHSGERTDSFFAASTVGKLSGASLHGKTFSFDRRIGFVGSYNLDPRSNRVNTEMGVLFDCPELTRRMPETIERGLDRNTYKLQLVGKDVEWVTTEGGKEVRFTSEPETGMGRRMKARVFSWLPIEGLL